MEKENKQCNADGCLIKSNSEGGKVHFISGYCKKHYSRFVRHGDANYTSRVIGENRVSHPLYRTYANMLNRCYNPKTPNWKHYGARGITVCDNWRGVNGFSTFVNCMDWPRDNESEKIHPTQKPLGLLKNLIEIFTDPGDVVIDPVAGSVSTIVAAEVLNRKGYGFEIKKDFCKKGNQWLNEVKQSKKDIETYGFDKTKLEKSAPTLWAISEPENELA